MQRVLGWSVLGVSGLGFPLTQVAIRALGRPGAALTEGVAAGLLARDIALVAMGAPGRLRRGPALMLYAETGVAAVAAGLCLPLVTDEQARQRARDPRWTGVEAFRRVVVGLLFGLHTMRFWIYLQPDHGRRTRTAAA